LNERKIYREALAAILVTTVIIAVILVLPGMKRHMRRGYATFLPLSASAEAAEISDWNQAVQKIKEDRGEPTGKQAKISIPAQLTHYSDTRRFLAIQVAEWREHHFETPHDYVGLAHQIKTGELVELKRVSENYVLFGVGGLADREPFTHYDNGSSKRIALYGEAELAQEYTRLSEANLNIENEIAGLRQELGSLSKRERSRRSKLQAQITGKQKALVGVHERKELLDDYYGNAEKRQQLLNDYQALADLAKNFSGHSFDMGDARARQEMKVRMLSFLRPEALKVLEEIAGSYRQKFERPLPVTSLVRPDEYQHMLSKVNPNATLIDTPPHSTGLAFDINYRYMTAEEQTYVMDYLARLEEEGRIEVLRENRDHYHVFAFVDGARPSEELIGQSLGKTSTAKALKETAPREIASRREEKRVERKAARKETAKKRETAKKPARAARSKRR
jgi:hypothetical protein